MAHFAELDDNNRVLRVIVVANDELLVDGEEKEDKGIQFCRTLFGSNTKWIQTSYNGSFRKNFAGVGFTYDPIRDAFYAPQTFPSFVLDEETCRWVESDTPELYEYIWDQEQQKWIERLKDSE